MELRTERWTVVVVDIVDILMRSHLFPSTFSVEGSHSLKSMLLCANIQARGVYTSDNVYDPVTLPSDMRFKFSFDLNKWEEYFDYTTVPTTHERS
jgi:hypothetical protein